MASMSKKIDNIKLEPKLSEREMKLNDSFGLMYRREIENAGRVIAKLEAKLWAWQLIERFNQLKLFEHIGDLVDESLKSYLQCLEIKRDELNALIMEGVENAK